MVGLLEADPADIFRLSPPLCSAVCSMLQILDQRGKSRIVHHGKGRHTSFALMDGRGDLHVRKALVNSDQQRKRKQQALAAIAMAGRRDGRKPLRRTKASLVFRQPAGPGHLIRVDVDHSTFGIDGRAAAAAPPSKPGKTMVCLPTLKGTNCPALRNPLNVSSANACAFGIYGAGQHLAGQVLPRKRRWKKRARLGTPALLARCGARRNCLLNDQKSRPKP